MRETIGQMPLASRTLGIGGECGRSTSSSAFGFTDVVGGEHGRSISSPAFGFTDTFAARVLGGLR
eukprot:4156883-Pleurochrysis_carterae.AAC.1